MIFQAGNVHGSASLVNLKEKKLIRKRVGFEPTTQMVQYSKPPLRICWMEVKQFKYIFHKAQPKKENLTSFETVLNTNQ